MPHETAAISAQVQCTPYNHAPVYSVILFKATCIHRVHVCLAVTCHQHFWQNDRDLLRATAVTWGWNGYRKESAHKVNPGEENSPAAPVWDLNLRVRPLNHKSSAL